MKTRVQLPDINFLIKYPAHQIQQPTNYKTMNRNFHKYADQFLQVLIVYVYFIKPNLMGGKIRESQGFVLSELVVGFSE